MSSLAGALFFEALLFYTMSWYVPHAHLVTVTEQVVVLSEQGIDQFTVTYDDGSVETWVRKGAAYAR